jgi:fatty-acyl-CoA synthase
VLHVAAVAKPDAYAGELPVAYVQKAAGANVTAEELAAFALEHVPERPAVPKEFHFLEAMPVTDIGKPDKVSLRFDAAKRAYAEALTGIPATVEVGPHETHGTQVSIAVKGLNAELEQRVRDVMKAYSHHYVVTNLKD